MGKQSRGKRQRPAVQVGKAKKKSSWVKEMLQTLLYAILIAAVLKLFIVDSRAIPSESMLPTIHIGDRVIMFRLSYIADLSPQRGDIVVFKAPADFEKRSDLIKRVIGLPGETLEVKDGKVWINGAALDEPYVQEAPDYSYGPVTIPDESYFMMGDNRNNSIDSHAWSNPFLHEDEIKGKAVWRYWPLNRMGELYE